MRLALAAVALASAIAPASAADSEAVTISIKRLRAYSTSSAEVLYEVTNNTGAFLDAIETSCAVKNKAGELIGVSSSYVRKVKAGETAAGKDFVEITKENQPVIGSAACRLLSTR